MTSRRRKDPQPEPESTPLSFEEAFQQLGNLVEALEQGSLPLAQATSLYQHGMELVRHCNQLLDQAELKITQLRDAFAGAEPDEPLFPEPEEEELEELN
ncbi:MAG: exodeoxyribonuclease VII small subunit [SAR202 cluster bacterium]|nr:exodeoxyribonuclease VII small subunit [SAR202 cluster bacterium]